MDAKELMKILEAAPKVGQVEAKDFVGFVSLIERRDQRTGAIVENPYMAVDGRVAMARLDHIKQGGKLDIGPLEVMEQTERTLTVQVKMASSLYGTVYGTATSRLDQTTRAGKPTIESASPWEVAETSAIGRALGMLGYGLLPGTGLASAEDIERATGNGDQAEVPAGEYVFTWGKHRGQAISRVPKDYLDWALKNTSDADARTAIREFLEGGEVKSETEQPEAAEEQGTPEESVPETKTLAGSTAFWAKARSLGISTPDGKEFQKGYTGEDGRIDWAAATEALGKKG